MNDVTGPRRRRAIATAAGALCLAVLGGGLPARAAVSGQPTTLAYWNADMSRGASGRAPESWTATPAKATSANSVTRVNAPAYFGRGTTALRIVDNSTRSSTVARSTAIGVTAGRFYVSNVNVYVSSGTAPTFYLEFLDSRGKVVGRRASTTTAPKAGHGNWMQAKGTAPSGTRSLRAVFYSTQGNRTTAYYRTPNIAETTPAQAYNAALGTGPVLFIGDERVASTTMTQVVHPATKYDPDHDGRANPVYDVKYSGRTASSQEYHSGQLGGTVMRNSTTGTYRMWFTGQSHSTGISDTWGSDSTNGLDWTWGVHQSTGTSIGANVAGVVPNRNRSDTTHRYLMLATNGVIGRGSTAAVTYRAYGSADGRTWKALSSNPVMPGRDVASVSYDPVTGRYVASTKQAGGGSDRQFFVSTSTDFVHWTTPRLAFRADSKDGSGSEIYQAPVFRYGEQLVSMPLIYKKAVGNGSLAPSLASSTDTDHFTRAADRRPVIPLGKAAASGVSSDAGFIILPSGPVVNENGSVVLVDGKIRLYYTGWNAGHDGTAARQPAIFMAQWRQDGFTSMHASGSKTLTTKTLRPTGSDLVVNAALTGAQGRLSASVVDPSTGKAYPGFEDSASSVVTGDHTAASVTWGGKTLASLAGRPVVLKFSVTDGDLYSFRIR